MRSPEVEEYVGEQVMTSPEVEEYVGEQVMRSPEVEEYVGEQVMRSPEVEEYVGELVTLQRMLPAVHSRRALRWIGYNGHMMVDRSQRTYDGEYIPTDI
jgi:hypothetical protein